MPTKIILGRSNPKNGVINQQDLKRIIQDFENFVDIKSTMSRPVTKINSVSIPLEIIENLIAPLSEAEKVATTVDIKFGVTLPDQKDCHDGVTDIENHLTVVILLNMNGKFLGDQVDNFIITPGFKEEGGAGDGACCPLIRPTKPPTP